jgi:hypothetical protein
MSRLQTIVAVFVGLAAAAGCRPGGSESGGQQGRGRPSGADQGASLLSAAVAHLNDLPSYVDTQLRPPAVILDSRTSADHKDVMAFCAVKPDAPEGPIFLAVPAGNAQFRRLGVQPDDIVRYYVLMDESVEEDTRQMGFARPKAMDLTVLQVLDESVLVVQGGSAPVPLEKFARIEIWRNLDDRLDEIANQLETYAKRRLPEIHWEPSPDRQALTQIVNWLNQWSRQSHPKAEWQRDPLLDSLDGALRGNAKLAARISPEALAAAEYEPYDGRLLQEAIWLRDISRWASGGEFEAVGRAAALFDWTVRNVQLDASAPPWRPWQVLLYGRGTALQRAWVFALLCRQQELDVVILSPTPETCWPALLQSGKLYLFDTRLGLPIPGPQGQEVATLQQLRDDATLLRRLDLADQPYPIGADQIQDLTASIVADPFDLSRRALQLERRLTGDNRVALATSPVELARALKQVPGIGGVRLWNVPFQSLFDQLELGLSARADETRAFEPFAWHPHLWKARALHFQGRLAQSGGDRSLGASTLQSDHRQAAGHYASDNVRPPDRSIARLAEARRPAARASRLSAAYWVGLMLYDDGEFAVAAEWLERPELRAAESPWAAGAGYNLGRALERLDNTDEAIALYEADTSPQRHGNRLRAKRLREKSE